MTQEQKAKAYDGAKERMRADYNIQHKFDQCFPLWHCVLYYLGWYEKSENRWTDLKKCLVMDGYCGESFSNHDVYSLILGIADDFNLYCANMGWNLISIGTIIGDDWWIRQYEERGLENPDWMYSIDKLFSKFALYYTREQVKLPCPDFKKGDPIRYCGFKNGKTYKEANKLTKTYNWYGAAPDLAQILAPRVETQVEVVWHFIGLCIVRLLKKEDEK